MNRVTLRKTLISCALLGGALLLAIVSMSLLGSERLPARASLCALASLGTRACGLTSDQFDILFQIRLPRILLAAAVGGSHATAGAGDPSQFGDHGADFDARAARTGWTYGVSSEGWRRT